MNTQPGRQDQEGRIVAGAGEEGQMAQGVGQLPQVANPHDRSMATTVQPNDLHGAPHPVPPA